MGLLKTIMSQSGKRKLGWVVRTNDQGVCLVVKRTPLKMSIKTKRVNYVSINESADNEEAGWALDEPLIRAIKSYKVEQVVVYVPKPGILYQTPASNYFAKGVVYMAPKSKHGDRIRCVGIQHFERSQYKVKL